MTRHCSRDFPTRHPWLDRKTARIHARRPSGLAKVSLLTESIGGNSTPWARSLNSRQARARTSRRENGAWKSHRSAFLHFPSSATTHENACIPEGRRTGSAPFFDRAMDGESKNILSYETTLIASSGRALSFGYFSLCQ